MDSEKALLENLKKDTISIWYDLAIDEAICRTVYALAYNTDDATMINLLKTARRNLAKFCKELDEDRKAKAKKEIDENILLSEYVSA